MKNKAVFLLNIAMIAAIFVLNYFYQRNDFDFTLKCICSGGFALLGIINLIHAVRNGVREKKFHIGMTFGLILAMLGDVLIGYNFIVGAAVFALGHICFVFAYCFLKRFCALDIIISAAFFVAAAAFLLFCPLLKFDVPVFRIVCLVYALIISLMLGKALGNFFKFRNKLSGTIALASALFFFSDLMLVFSWFIGRWSWTGNACMGTYYPALCLLAFSMFLKTIHFQRSNPA